MFFKIQSGTAAQQESAWGVIDQMTQQKVPNDNQNLTPTSQTDNDVLETLVNRTLEALGLTEAKDLKVGNPLQKTISGGQRKRLNIGLELLREPSVLFVDEPTSGLSSRDSENIMDLLKELSLRGKMVFVVIHQPSSDIFKMFDSLLILDKGGHQIYYGNLIAFIEQFWNQYCSYISRSTSNKNFLHCLNFALIVFEDYYILLS